VNYNNPKTRTVSTKSLLPNERSAVVRSITGGSRSKLSDILVDFYQSIKSSDTWFYSAWIDILLTYRSTLLGPLWISIGTGLFVFVIGTLYGRVIFTAGSNIYLAHLAVGIVLWYFINKSIGQSCNVFFKDQDSILDGATTYPNLILKTVTTHLITLLHNSVIVVIAFLVVGLKPTLTALLLIGTLPLVIANLLWMCMLAGIFGARYADFKEMVGSALRLFFFLTPILWVPHQDVRGPMVDAALYVNPFYYMVEVVRAPLVYGKIPILEISVLLAVLPLGWLLAGFVYMRTKRSIALWL
jgi:ABC-type polysaccharide/polyol phosphate export permease